MNSFGTCFQVNIFGESHAGNVGVVVSGVPAGLPLNSEDFIKDLDRRKPGLPGTTSRTEPDAPCFMSGILNGRATGAPVAIAFQNQNACPEDYVFIKDTPRPGHADWAASYKYGGFNDHRGGGQFSGRLTAGLAAAGVIAKKMIRPVRIEADLLEAGGSKDISETIRRVSQEKDSIGGLIECRARNLPPGLGEPFFDSVESLISHIVFAVPGIKGIEFGAGFACSRMRGSECNDRIVSRHGKTATNHSGGINGGITNGNELVFRVAVRPTPSISKPQKTVNMRTGEMEMLAIKGRHDTCIALRIPVIIEAAAAVVLADLMLQGQKVKRIWEEK
jgi:chorismate synthase